MSTLDPVTLAVIQSGLQQVCNEMDLAFVRAAFSLRRKMLRNSLQPLIPTLQARGLSLEDMADEAQIDLTQRAENLSVDQYATLTRVIDTAG